MECALVAVVEGTRLDLTPSDVQAYIMGHFRVELGTFMVHPHYLEEFLVLFRDASVMLQVLNAQVPLGAVRIVFRRWHRENWTSAATMDFCLKVGLVGVPAYLWLMSTA